ncbi:hypothetical protein SPRG_18145 [Saprolegnia parasitica CBS 223.65]|uniref:Uncharacterized protein n=1 Tax=Saprolegnia parasitica (strain CBS 223.65) TaxID=695850 RepID=A0A067BHW5_SAPPC|nr:hypothetical protein SPRG_18145 [Saprolegnia parasitica CBS 223.65]KDO16320.1 hypothetical protein SPRG_18145 [Saprolegnia parasitica CBS 223.65]|eukprot:XP_012212972.1 hypothetical protein SPRG_18145 [Saprolegnia parasitica CBS 223.65]
MVCLQPCYFHCAKATTIYFLVPGSIEARTIGRRILIHSRSNSLPTRSYQQHQVARSLTDIRQ